MRMATKTTNKPDNNQQAPSDGSLLEYPLTDCSLKSYKDEPMTA